MIGARPPIVGEQRAHQIDGLIIDRIKLDRLGQPRKQGCDALEPGERAMGNSDIIAQLGQAKFLAASNGYKELGLRVPG